MALTEDSKPARVANLLYEPTRDAVLRDHLWNFAIKRAACAQLTDTPAFGYSYKYQLPDDCLRVVSLEDIDTQYSVEGSTILTDNSTCNIIYVSRIEDPNLFDSLFVEALSSRLAMEFAYILSDDLSLVDGMRTLYKEKLRDARSVDAQESGAREIVATTWLDSMQ